MFRPDDILYEDNHLLIVNKHGGDLVQPDPSGESALEDQIKAFIKERDAKPGEVFLGVVHRIDRPVSGAVLFAKTSKALVRLNEMIREGHIRKIYWALTERTPEPEEGQLTHYILRDGRTNRSRAYDAPRPEAKLGKLRYRTLNVATHYTLVEVELLTGRHHQIRAQLSKIGCPIRGDLKYGAKRSLPEGGISLHSRTIAFDHPVRHEPITVTAPVPQYDNLWAHFDSESAMHQS
ncbi:MAG: RNA pseudouridine synthase [Alistipes sp.]|nr:RNA pseudouridine synthase [Alistipes sp.]